MKSRIVRLIQSNSAVRTGGIPPQPLQVQSLLVPGPGAATGCFFLCPMMELLPTLPNAECSFHSASSDQNRHGHSEFRSKEEFPHFD